MNEGKSLTRMEASSTPEPVLLAWTTTLALLAGSSMNFVSAMAATIASRVRAHRKRACARCRISGRPTRTLLSC